MPAFSRKILFLVFLVSVFVFGSTLSYLNPPPFQTARFNPFFAWIAQAEDDEEEEDEDEEEEEREDEDEEYSSSKNSSPSNQTTTRQVITYQQITKTTQTVAPGYDKDTDGDGIVDAIDPDPSKDQREYFTDSDQDGIPNAYDKHPGKDDFTYDENAQDENQNGVIDSYEQL